MSLKSHGHPTRHFGDKTCILFDLFWISAPHWDQLWEFIRQRLGDVDHQIGVQFPEFVFIDLGVDMAPGCDAWMRIEHLKYNG